jgi:hypothetical protein
MVQCDIRLELPPYARTTLNKLDYPIDPLLTRIHVLTVELPGGIRIDCTWDRDDGGYSVAAWHCPSGEPIEIVRRLFPNRESVAQAVADLARMFS